MNENQGCGVPSGMKSAERYPKDVTIMKVLNGFDVRVGCKNLVFEDKAKMLKEYLEKYK